MSETSKDDFSGVLDRLDQLAEIPTGVTAIADEALFRDAAAAIRELTTRLDAANGRIKRWQISASCGDPGYEMQGGKLVCKGCGRAAQEIFQQSGERECRTTNASSIETAANPEPVVYQNCPKHMALTAQMTVSATPYSFRVVCPICEPPGRQPSKATAECRGCKEGWERLGAWHWDSIGHMHECTAQNGSGESHG